MAVVSLPATMISLIFTSISCRLSPFSSLCRSMYDMKSARSVPMLMRQSTRSRMSRLGSACARIRLGGVSNARRRLRGGKRLVWLMKTTELENIRIRHRSRVDILGHVAHHSLEVFVGGQSVRHAGVSDSTGRVCLKKPLVMEKSMIRRCGLRRDRSCPRLLCRRCHPQRGLLGPF